MAALKTSFHAGGCRPASAKTNARQPRITLVLLSHSLNRQLARRLDQLLNRRLDGRPGRPTNYLAQACTLLDQYILLRRRAIKAEPHLFGPHAGAYYRDTLKRAAGQVEIEAALDKVYGPSPPGSPPAISVWTERYFIPPAGRKRHRRWFRKQYGA